MLARRGQDQATETEIARAAAALLDKAGQGPGREGSWPGPEGGRPGQGGSRRRALPAGGTLPSPQRQPPAWDEEEDDGPLAEVIPLGVFDAREEAKKWW